MSNIWLNQNSRSSVWLSNSVEQKLKDHFIQEWSEDMNPTSKDVCYRIFKTELKIERYISISSYNYMFTTSITWLRSNVILNINADSRLTNGDESIQSLSISNVQQSDSGRYVCRAADVTGTVVNSKTITVTPQGMQQRYISISSYNYMFNFCKFRCGGDTMYQELTYRVVFATLLI
jgi:hypothetical protein